MLNEKLTRLERKIEYLEARVSFVEYYMYAYRLCIVFFFIYL